MYCESITHLWSEQQAHDPEFGTHVVRRGADIDCVYLTAPEIASLNESIVCKSNRVGHLVEVIAKCITLHVKTKVSMDEDQTDWREHTLLTAQLESKASV
jgi:hypothetical protein